MAFEVSAIILCWNEGHIVSQSLARLAEEKNIQIIVVDNGSEDDTLLKLKSLSIKFDLITLNRNMGTSIARNIGIDAAVGKHIFMMDGDIVYAHGTIPQYLRVLNTFDDAGVVGFNDYERLCATGHNGTDNTEEAHALMSPNFVVSDWFPMAWTQYGLFRGEALRKFRFVEKYPFNEPGYGFEDEWLYREMRSSGYASLALNKPLYFHAAHSGWIQLESKGIPNKLDERRKVFEQHWGPSYLELLPEISKKQTIRPYRRDFE
jgi:glycosyltransferase involved in cell wall biosynthesis